MTITPEILPRRPKPRIVLFLAFQDMCLLDMTGPLTAFWAAGTRMKERKQASYECVTVSMRGGMIRTVEGVTLATRAIADFPAKTVDTIVVPGTPLIESIVDKTPDIIEWLRRAAPVVRRTTSVCTGAFFLARAGLLDGGRATTHWAMCAALKQRHPSVEVDDDAIYVRQGKIWMSAGVTAGIDLALALIEEDCGREITLSVARELVVFLKRPGGQSQHSELLTVQAQDHGGFDELHLWLAKNIGDKGLTVERLAEKARMSPRNFARVYKEATKRTPAKAIEAFRMQAAGQMLQESGKNIDQIAEQCGFGDAERMRVAFQRKFGISPRAYRERFAS